MNIDEVGEYLEHQGLTDDDIDEVLAHFGVKGQKWGVRRAKKQARAMTKAGRKEALYKATLKNNKTQRRVATGAAFIATNLIANGIAKKANLNKTFVVSTMAIGTVAVNGMMREYGARRINDL